MASKLFIIASATALEFLASVAIASDSEVQQDPSPALSLDFLYPVRTRSVSKALARLSAVPLASNQIRKIVRQVRG
jgi:hypothetical protein